MKTHKGRLGHALGAALRGLAALGAFTTTFTLAASPALAQKPPADRAKPKVKKPKAQGAAKKGDPGRVTPIALNLPIQRVTLENGLRVVMNIDRTSPTVSIAVMYDAGSRREREGQSGFAHLFEHMMFQGSKNLPKGEHARLITSHGGHATGGTGPDVTVYTETLPSSELALGLWLEADRMKSLDVSAENFENQRRVVQEEVRGGILNSAYGQSSIRLESLVYQGYWPYQHPTAGSLAELDAAKLEWVQDFHAHHYGPNNAALVISGDFDADPAMELVHRYFDGIPRINAEPFKDPGLPEQTNQRTAVLHDDFARTPGILYGWATPPSRHADHYALELAAILLARGESSRLYKLLVREKAVAQSVVAHFNEPPRIGPDVFTVDMTLTENAKAGDVEKLVEAEVKKLATTPPSEAEMVKARRSAQSSFVLRLQSSLGRAVWCGIFELMFGDARHINNELDRYTRVTGDDIKRVAAHYLGPTHRTIVETYPTKREPSPTSESAKSPRTPQASPHPNDHPSKSSMHASTTGKTSAKKKDGGKPAHAAKKKAAPGPTPKKPRKP